MPAVADPLAAVPTDDLVATNAAIRKMAETPAGTLPASLNGFPAQGGPGSGRGEQVMKSRPFRLSKLLGVLTGAIDPAEAKLELEVTKAFRRGLADTQGLHSEVGAGFLMPVAKSFLKDESAHHEATEKYCDVLAASFGETADRDEIEWNAKNNASGTVRKAAMSYLNDTIGGTLVAPPTMGDLIPLIRNKSAVNRAGATQVPLPPSGKWVAPRVTGPSTGYWITENTAITESNPTTGEVTMQAKKNAVLIRVPNELFRFATAFSDALLRNDIVKTVALNFDYDCLYGPGGGRPKGIIQYTGSTELYDYAVGPPIPSGVATNGNVLNPEDGYRMAAAIEDRSFDIEGFKWIMRGKMKGAILSRRADAVTAADNKGPFVQSLTRGVEYPLGENWCGYPLITSSQVRNNQVKGSSGATLTEVFGGAWEHFFQGIYGAMEFATANQGDTAFAADQTLVRGILFCDCVPRYPGAFTYYKQLLMS
jgi:HK97 family phage major capsid protein